MASVDIINFESKLRLGHVKVSSGNGYAFGLELYRGTYLRITGPLNSIG